MTKQLGKYRSRRIRARIREILLREWDPIGVRDVAEAQDEYDTYVAKLLVMLIHERRSADEMAAYLHYIETDYMGLSDVPGVRERCTYVAELLVKALPALEAESDDPF